MIHAAVQRWEVSPPGFSFLRGLWIFLFLSIVLGMGYLWLQSRVMDTGWQLKAVENSVPRLREKIVLLQVRLARLKNPRTIKARIEESGLALSSPEPGQIVRIRARAEESLPGYPGNLAWRRNIREPERIPGGDSIDREKP
jgi:hypothetical protein